MDFVFFFFLLSEQVENYFNVVFKAQFICSNYLDGTVLIVLIFVLVENFVSKSIGKSDGRWVFVFPASLIYAIFDAFSLAD